MTNKNLEHIREMTRRCITKMFDPEIQSDEQKARENMEDYTALCAAVTALEMQEGLKPKRDKDTSHFNEGVDGFFCAHCGKALLDSNNDIFFWCPDCGNRVDWSDARA